MPASKVSHGFKLPGPTSKALRARMPLSSYSKLLNKLIPSHLTEGVFGVLGAIKLAFTPIVPLPDSMA